MSRHRFLRAPAIALVGAVLLGACGRGAKPEPRAAPAAPRPSILLVTLDTTRADAIGPEARGRRDAGVRRAGGARAALPPGLRDRARDAALARLDDDGALSGRPRRARERARRSPPSTPSLAERLQRRRLPHGGVRVAASCWRGASASRAASTSTTTSCRRAAPSARRARRRTRALAHLARPRRRAAVPLGPLLRPARAVRAARAVPRAATRRSPYLGEVAAMDEQLGRLVAAFERQAAGPAAIVVVADHGEGLGDHGESQHGNLLYQSTMHVPLRARRARRARRASTDTPVSTRRVFHTVLDWAGPGRRRTACARPTAEVVLGEAMKPFLAYGWQPQVMAVEGRHKAILAGTDRDLRRGRRSRARRATSRRRPPSRAAARRAARVPGPVAGGAPAPDALRRGRNAGSSRASAT